MGNHQPPTGHQAITLLEHQQDCQRAAQALFTFAPAPRTTIPSSRQGYLRSNPYGRAVLRRTDPAVDPRACQARRLTSTAAARDGPRGGLPGISMSGSTVPNNASSQLPNSKKIGSPIDNLNN